jgi:tetratricopeptide (TPR) repeat protein
MKKTLLPATFEARGLLVPFENPKLRPVRVRAGPDQRLKEWEAVFENHAGEKGRQNLVMQWIHLPNWTQMAPRDRALFDQISRSFEKKGVDPLALRALAVKIELEHADDEAKRAAAKQRIDAISRDALTAYVSLLAQATRECGIARGDAFMARANSAVLMQAIQSAPDDRAGGAMASLSSKVFAHLSEQAKVPPNEVSKRIESLADMLAPIGAINLDSDPGGKQEGHLSLSFARLERFAAAVAAYEKTARDDPANRALLVLFSARQFVDRVRQKLSDIEQRLSFFAAVIRDFDGVAGAISAGAREIAYSLDGWDALVDVWEEAVRRSERAQDEAALDLAIQHVLLYLPTMPANATNRETEKVWNGISFQRVKMVRYLENWIDGSVDAEMQARMKIARAEAAT